MFMCKQCWEQFEDKDLAYTLILEARLNHPAAETFLLKFCSKAHVQQFLEQISHQRQKYVLTKKGKTEDKQYGPDYPKELLLLVGSSKAS
jgi:hypothetical protein